MSLATILEALGKELQGVSPLQDGPEYLTERSAPSIVAVPTEEQLVEPEDYDPAAPPAIAQRNADVVFHLLGEKRADTELLLNALVNALRAQVGRSYRYGSGHWTSQELKALQTYGRGYELTVTFFVPVPADPVQAGVVHEIEEAVEFTAHPAEEP